MVACENCGADNGDLAGFACRDLAPCGVLDLDLHPRPRKAASADAHRGVISRVMDRGQHGDVACDFTQAKILH